MLENQLSRYGAIAKALPLMSPGAKVFFLAPSSAAWFGDFQHEFPADKDGFARVHTTFASVLANGGVTANKGDVVVALPGYTETLSATLSLTVAGVQWIGIGEGLSKPTITVSVANHGVALAANNITFDNFHFAAPGTDAALSMIRLDDSTSGITVRNITGVGSTSANNFVSGIVIGTSNDHKLENIAITTGAVAMDNFLSFEGAVSRSTIGGFFAFGSIATAGIIDASGARIKTANWKDINISIRGATGIPAATLDATGSYGFLKNSNFAGTHTTIATNAAFGTGWRLFDVKVLEDIANTVQGALIPAVDSE